MRRFTAFAILNGVTSGAEIRARRRNADEGIHRMAAETIGITVTSDMLRTIRESVASGEYASAGEVLREALRLWQRERQARADELEAIRQKIRRAVGDPSAPQEVP